jgi:uncharacterized phage protein gp47/JayE
MPPVISSVTPSKGNNDVLTPIIILGTGFSGSTVLIGTTSATSVVVINPNTITCDVPIGIVPNIYDVKVTNVDTSNDTLEDSFRVTLALPETPFTGQTLAIIISRMLSQIPSTWDIREGSFFRDLLQTSGLEFEQLYSNLDVIFTSIYAQFASESYLDLRAEEFGLTRKPANKAIGRIDVTGTNGTIVPVGTLFSTVVLQGSEGRAIRFETTEQATIGAGVANIPSIAEEGGIAGNVGSGTITQLVSTVVGIASITNNIAFTGGTDKETDVDFRERFLVFVRNPISGGNKADYVTWAQEVAGVGLASTIPIWNGPGTVKVLILDTAGDPASAGLITNVQNYISPTASLGEGKAPIGANVTVAAPDVIDIDVSVNITITAGADGPTVEAAVEAALIAFLKTLNIGEDVLYAAIANVVFDTTDVVDYNTLLVNGGISNVVIASDEKATDDVITATAV